MKCTQATLITILGTLALSQGDLLVYEPFDYKPHNHEIAGRVEGRNGGLGFAEAWKDSDNPGYAFIYDQRGNPLELYGGGWGENDPKWDGMVDNLPTMGGYMGTSDWDRSGSPHSTRKLAKSAGAMAKDGVLWMSAVWHMPNQSFFAPVGIALASNDGGFKDRALSMNDKADAIGAGNYAIAQDGGTQLSVKSARFDPDRGAVVLTTEETLKPDTNYTIVTKGLTDLANLALMEPGIKMRTWDDDPKGIKVFILSGQSNMCGYGHSEIGKGNLKGAPGTLRHLAINNSQYPEFDYTSLLADPKQPDTSDWKTRGDVKLWWRNGASAKYGGRIDKGDLGPLTNNGQWFGPELPFVIATTGMGYGGEPSPHPYEPYHAVEKAQLWVSGVEKPAKVMTDDTRHYFEPHEKSPRNQGFHWHGNARSYFRIGLGLGENMVELLEE